MRGSEGGLKERGEGRTKRGEDRSADRRSHLLHSVCVTSLYCTDVRVEE